MAKWYSSDTHIAWACSQLIKGRKISHMDEINAVYGWRLSAIIYNLRHRYDWPIDTEYDGKKIAHYQLRKGIDPEILKLPKSFLDYLKDKPRDE